MTSVLAPPISSARTKQEIVTLINRDRPSDPMALGFHILDTLRGLKSEGIINAVDATLVGRVVCVAELSPGKIQTALVIAVQAHLDGGEKCEAAIAAIDSNLLVSQVKLPKGVGEVVQKAGVEQVCWRWAHAVDNRNTHSHRHQTW